VKVIYRSSVEQSGIHPSIHRITVTITITITALTNSIRIIAASFTSMAALDRYKHPYSRCGVDPCDAAIF